MSEQGGPYGPGGATESGRPGAAGLAAGTATDRTAGLAAGTSRRTGPQGWQQATAAHRAAGLAAGPPPHRSRRAGSRRRSPPAAGLAAGPTTDPGLPGRPGPAVDRTAARRSRRTGQEPQADHHHRHRRGGGAGRRRPRVYFFAIRDSNTDAADRARHRRRQSVDALFKTLSNSDPIGLADQLDPAEAALFTDLNSDMITELKRLEVLSPEASADSMTGTTITVDGLTMQDQTETINDHVQIVKLTGGTVTVASDPTNIPLSDTFKEQFGSEIDAGAAAVPDGQHRRRGRRERRRADPGRHRQARRQLVRQPLLHDRRQRGPRRGSAQPDRRPTSSRPRARTSPEDAVDALIERAQQGDLKSVIALLPPDEMGVLHDYGQLILDQADAGDLTTEMHGPRLRRSTTITYDVTDVTGGKKVSLKSIDAHRRRPDRHHRAGSRGRFGHPDGTGRVAVTLDETTIDTYLADADRLRRAGPAGGWTSSSASSSS